MIVVLGLIVSGCNPVVPPAEQDELGSQTKAPGTVTVILLDSNNNGLAGGDVYYYDSGWKLLGTTAVGTGMVSGAVPKTTDIEIRYAGGKYKWVLVDPAGNPTLTINTVPVTVKLETCSGVPLAGEAYWNAGSALGGYLLIGTTPATKELLPGTYSFKVRYDNRQNVVDATIGTTPAEVLFKTTKVTGTGTIYYYVPSPISGWVAFTSPKEMLPGSYDFRFGSLKSPTETIIISGCSMDLTPPIDETPPVVTITVPVDGTSYTLNQAVLADWTATDDLSGIASAVGTVPSGLPIDTGTVGAKTFTVTATDNAGNTATKTVTYTVIYGFNGLLSPYEETKAFKIGSSIPLKWQYTDAAGNVVDSSAAIPRVRITQVNNVPPPATEDPIEIEDPGKSGLRYDSSTDMWIFNWQTKGSTAGTYWIWVTSAQTGQMDGPYPILLK